MTPLYTTSISNNTHFLEDVIQQICLQNPIQGCPIQPQQKLSLHSKSSGREQLSAFYHAIATQLERETGQMTETFINLNPAGLGWVLIFCNRILVISQFIPNAQRFQFKSLDHLVQEGENNVQEALEVAKSYFDFSPQYSVPLQQAS